MQGKTQENLNFEQLKPYKRRVFVPYDAEFTSVDEIRSIYELLLERGIASSSGLERWIMDRSEFEAALDQQASIIYIRMTCQTDNEAYAKAYQDYIEKTAPVVKELEDRLNKKFLSLVEQFPIDEERYGLYIRAIKTDDELFVKENIELQKKIGLLSQEYQAVTGKQMVEFQGKERTMPEMSKFLLEPDRGLREEAFRKVNERRLQDKEKLDDLFDQMTAIRNQTALNAGFDNYVNYKFKSLHRFDYAPSDCLEYHKTVEEIVVPIWKRILKNRRVQMGLDILKPWDLSADPFGREPLKPFTKSDELINGCSKIFHTLNTKLGSQFDDMAERGLLDLNSRKGKAPGGYQSTLNETRKPFIFMNSVGVDQDVRTLLHEGGHAFHSLACAHDDLIDYRHGPMEFNEVASMTMELLGGEYLSVFYEREDEARSKAEHLEGIVQILVWVATIDCFQHWIYQNQDHTREERRSAWLNIRTRFSGEAVDWTGLEEVEAFLWHRQLHIFEVPFYYIEYAIAQLGALQIWMKSCEDFSGTLEAYLSALKLGGSKTLPELFKTAGIEFNFSKNVIEPLMGEVAKQLEL